MYRLCAGEQYLASEVEIAETECDGRPEGCQGRPLADGERIDQPESWLSALEGQWNLDGDQWYGEHQGR